MTSLTQSYRRRTSKSLYYQHKCHVQRKKLNSEIRGSHNGVDEDSEFVKYDAVYIGKQLQAFRRFLRFCAACALSLVNTLYKPIHYQLTFHLLQRPWIHTASYSREHECSKFQGFWTYKIALKNMRQGISDDSVLTRNTGIANNKKETGHDLHHFLRNPLLSLSQSFCLWCILKATVHRSALGHTPYGTTHPAEETDLTGVHSSLRLARARLAEKHNR